MKSLVIILVSLFSTSAIASDYEMLMYMLNSEQVKAEFENRDLNEMNFFKENLGTGWNYVLRITTIEAGLGSNGPDTHPCFTNVSVTTIGGVAGTEISDPEVETICAMNAPTMH